jgi:hypothetical protein
MPAVVLQPSRNDIHKSGQPLAVEAEIAIISSAHTPAETPVDTAGNTVDHNERQLLQQQQQHVTAQRYGIDAGFSLGSRSGSGSGSGSGTTRHIHSGLGADTDKSETVVRAAGLGSAAEGQMSSEQFNQEVDIETLALEDNVLLKTCWRRWRKQWWSRTDLEDNVSLLSSYLERTSKGAIERRRTAVVESAEAESFSRNQYLREYMAPRLRHFSDRSNYFPGRKCWQAVIRMYDEWQRCTYTPVSSAVAMYSGSFQAIPDEDEVLACISVHDSPPERVRFKVYIRNRDATISALGSQSRVQRL